MGHRKYSAPRRGSLAYLPRGRSSHWAPRIRFWPEYEGAPKLLAFAGFKAGTSHVTIVDNRQGSLNYGKEVTLPVTVVETPPLLVTGLRFYERFNGALRTSGEVWAPEPSKDLGRRIKVPEKFDDNKGWEKLESTKEKVVEVRAIAAGQMGFAQRTEYNKQILKIGDNGADVTPKGGFLHYGPIKTEFTLLRGTIPGPANRLVALRTPARGRVSGEPPKMEMISLASKQGA